MQLTVKLFGSLREQAGAKELALELPDGSRVSDLRQVLAERYPILDKLGGRVAASVNLELAEPGQVLSEGDEVAFLPPVAGGSAPSREVRAMQKIADEAACRWPGTRVAIAHRTGCLQVGEAAVVIAAAAPHRAEAFEACRFAIDTLKQTVPIWKKEVATDGEYWVDDHA